MAQVLKIILQDGNVDISLVAIVTTLKNLLKNRIKLFKIITKVFSLYFLLRIQRKRGFEKGTCAIFYLNICNIVLNLYLFQQFASLASGSIFIKWNGVDSAEITMARNPDEDSTGLCGNFNGDSADEFQNPSTNVNIHHLMFVGYCKLGLLLFYVDLLKLC